MLALGVAATARGHATFLFGDVFGDVFGATDQAADVVVDRASH
jgi:hypothetical protein